MDDGGLRCIEKVQLRYHIYNIVYAESNNESCDIRSMTSNTRSWEDTLALTIATAVDLVSSRAANL